MTYRPGDRVEITSAAKAAILTKYDSPQAVDGVGVVVSHPLEGFVPQEILDAAVDELGYGNVWVIWQFDPETPVPMLATELQPWTPSRQKHPQGRFSIGDVVMTTANYCPCTRCDFTAGCVLEFNPPGITVGNTVGHPYLVQWDDGWVTYDDEAELCFVGERHNKED